MFKRTRRRILAAILLVLVVVLGGTFVVIYLASYADMTHENRGLLEQYVKEYTYPETTRADPPSQPQPPQDAPHIGPPRLQLSTFYSVAIAPDGTVLKVDTAEISTISSDALIELAQEIIAKGKPQGVQQHLIYCMADKGDYTLVAFLDNTVVLESAAILINYTLLFGGAALVLLGVLAWVMAARIVAPLEENHRRQKQFISDAGYELKTPVAVLSTNLELLSREVGPNPWIANMQYETERISSLIRQLLDLARAESAAIQPQLLDLSRLVCGETLPFESVAYEQGLALNSTVEPDLWIEGDSARLKQLVSILLDNAISRSAPHTDVTLTLRREMRQAVLTVSNTGTPIPPEVQPHLFERFYRQDPARSDSSRHYGLGLAIAKAITEAHKGSIGVECSNGTIRFFAKLPLRR